LYGKEYLKNKLSQKKVRINARYRYYDMKNHVEQAGKMMPDEFRWISQSLGWCAKAVDSLSDRIVFDCFDRDSYELNEIYSLNNPDILHDSAVLSALISSCSFIYIGIDENNYPKLQVIDGGNATGDIDTATNMLTEGYAVIERDKHGNPTLEAYFQPFRTEYFSGGKTVQIFEHKAPYALLVPVIFRPDAKRPFGHSRISRTCMNVTQAVLRTMQRMEVSAEFYSVPQKYVLGLSESSEFNGKRALYSNFLSFTKDEEGDKPVLGQFSQQSMSPYSEQLRTLASIFAGETGLTLDDLGFATANPASCDAIRASHENLRLTAKKAQRSFGTGFLNAGYLSACVRDGFEYQRKAFVQTRCIWNPVFEPDATALSGIGDAILKINQACPDFLGTKNLKQLTGLEGENDG